MKLSKGYVAKVWQLDRLVEGWGQPLIPDTSLSVTSDPKELKLAKIEEETGTGEEEPLTPFHVT
jgi:hypothetical protein